MWRIVLLGGFGTAFALGPLLFSGLRPNDYKGGRSKSIEDSIERNTSSVARVLGEVRTSMSDIMFMKTERYLHNGIGYAPHLTESEIMGDAGSHEGTATTIRSGGSDFRGFVGVLERKVKPWRDPSLPHIHSDGAELLPWYRLMTASDPNCERCYAIGGWWLKTHNPEEGVKFLEEGVANNPDSFAIRFMLGQVLREVASTDATTAKNPAETGAAGDKLLEYSVRARDVFAEGAEIVMRVRYDGAFVENKAEWNDHVEDDATGVCRMAALMEEKFGDPVKALEMARRYHAKFVADRPLEMFIERVTKELEKAP